MDEIKNILIAGATGLIGTALVRRLITQSQYHVWALGRNEQRARTHFANEWHHPRFHFISHDITQPLPPTHHTFHHIIDAASGAAPHLYSTAPVDVMKSNLLGVCNLLDYGIRHGLTRFLYISSGESYGQGDGRILTEDYSGYVDPMAFRSCYPSSKRAAETLTASYAHQYGIHAMVARPCHIYGPHFSESDNRVYAQFIRNALNGQDIIMKSSGSQYRSWCHVDDCVDALLTILHHGQSGEAYNIADPQSNITIRQLAEMIADITGRKVVIDTPDETERAGYNPVRQSILSTAKLQQLGWNITGTMRQKMEKTIHEAATHTPTNLQPAPITK